MIALEISILVKYDWFLGIEDPCYDFTDVYPFLGSFTVYITPKRNGGLEIAFCSAFFIAYVISKVTRVAFTSSNLA